MNFQIKLYSKRLIPKRAPKIWATAIATNIKTINTNKKITDIFLQFLTRFLNRSQINHIVEASNKTINGFISQRKKVIAKEMAALFSYIQTTE